jgi:hypothetical protein
MAQYLLAVRYGDQPSPEEFRQLCVDVPALAAKLEDAGVFVFHGGLRSPETTATVVRQSGDDFLITDGPYTETKEHLAGFWIIDVADLDAALEWAKRAAAAELRPIEVRPFFEGDLDDAIRINASGSQ